MPPAAVAALIALLAANDTARLDCVCRHVANATDDRTEGEAVIWDEYCEDTPYFSLWETCESLKPPSNAVPAVARLVPRGWWSRQSPPAEEWEEKHVQEGEGAEERELVQEGKEEEGEVEEGEGEEEKVGQEGKAEEREEEGVVDKGQLGQEEEEGEEEEQVCGGNLAEVRRLTKDEATDVYWDLPCRIATECIDTCSVQGLDVMEWNATVLATDDLRRSVLSQLVHAVRRVTKAVEAMKKCEEADESIFSVQYSNKTEFEAAVAEFLRDYSRQWRNGAQLLSIGVTHLSELLVPLAFEHMMGNHTSDQQFHGWIENMERVRNMLQTRLSGWVHDMRYASKQIANYRIEENEINSGEYIFRRPVLNDGLLDYIEFFLSLREDFGELCREQQPQASQMFAFADALYYFYRSHWLQELRYSPSFDATDEEWQLEDQSNTTVSVDTGCLQLLADAVDHPRCPLEPRSLEESRLRRQCRQQLWEDMVHRRPHIPVTSYLAYTQRARVSVCLLAWMAANSLSLCQDVPFSIMRSVHDARCYFNSPQNQSCLQSNAADAICSVSRAILFMKCRDFSYRKPPRICAVRFYTGGSHGSLINVTWDVFEGNIKPTQKTLNYRNSLNHATLKYRNFKIDNLKPLEISFISLNIIFRFFTTVVYMYFSRLRNLPGKILLAFQITGLIQIFCSEVLYRMIGVPGLSTAVLIDSAITLLSCLLLNTFSYQVYAGIRDLRLPDELSPAEASKIFRRRMLYALIPWSIVCATCIALEKTNKYYVLHSRILLLTGVSLSVAFNLVCLGLIAYMYLRTRKSMQELKIQNKGKFASKKQLVFMSVKSVILSGIGIIVRMGFHQAQDIAQYVYYVYLATMMQGPVLFVCFACNGTALPLLRDRALALWKPDMIRPGQELGSAAAINLARRRKEQSVTAESPL